MDYCIWLTICYSQVMHMNYANSTSHNYIGVQLIPIHIGLFLQFHTIIISHLVPFKDPRMCIAPNCKHYLQRHSGGWGGGGMNVPPPPFFSYKIEIL